MRDDSELPSPVSIMGIRVSPFDSYGHAVRAVSSRIDAGVKTFCVAVNPHKAWKAQIDRDLYATLNAADMHICDGVGIALAARLLLGKRISRCTGVQLFFDLLKEAAQKQWKVFLLGASPESNDLARSNLVRMYPHLRIVDYAHGYFQDSSAVITQINESQADLLFVAMGSPKQEFWISENRSRIDALFCMGIGGTLDVVSGKARWAPSWVRRLGLEWAYRTIHRPHKLFPRLVTGILFALRTFVQLIVQVFT
jgi:N-acetylglucosaminyldiphosphoundecaprenol N-acetyl-beta-D-mannosaminyltransferase